MSGSRRATAGSSAESGIDDIVIESDLAKVDAHEISRAEYDEIPELTDEVIERADFYVGDRFVRRGLSGTPEDTASVQLLPEVVRHFRAAGPGWQARVNRVLLTVVERERSED